MIDKKCLLFKSSDAKEKKREEEGWITSKQKYDGPL
jgi:hypothetical protein